MKSTIKAMLRMLGLLHYAKRLRSKLQTHLAKTKPEGNWVTESIKASVESVISDDRKVISTIEELDEIMLLADSAETDDELRSIFTTFHMEFPFELPSDPYSEEYKEVQFDFYQKIASKTYSTENEATEFDVATAVKTPFPYGTQSASTTGNQLMAVGHIIKTLDLPAQSTILEFGPGWGNTTLALARMGYKVTAVDIEKRFLELISERANQKSISVETIHSSFSYLNETDRQWDAVLFFECFHHSDDHTGLISQLDRVVAPGGKVAFAAEPITDALPFPWGFRLDGESLWAIRKFGWCELGFQETYFRDLMSRYGWVIEKCICHDTPWGVIYIATRKSES